MPLEGQTYLNRGAVVELEESRWVIVDVNNLDGDVYVLMQWGAPTVGGSEPQVIARSLVQQDTQWRVSSETPQFCPLIFSGK